jgi:hypothetical protein
MTNKEKLSGLFMILSALGFLLVGCTSLNRETKATDLFVSKTYEIATASYNRNDFLTAIHQYREVLKIRPGHSGSKKYLKLAWDKLLEENKNLYPSPFEGQYVLSREAEFVPSQVTLSNPNYFKKGYTYNNGRRIPYYFGEKEAPYYPYYYDEEKGEPILVTIPEHTIPAAIFLYIFKDKSYTFIECDGIGNHIGTQIERIFYHQIEEIFYYIRRKKEGTFYYNGNNLELDDGTILIYSNNVLRDQQNREFTRKQEHTDNEK